VAVADIKEHHARTHFAANMRFIVAGNLSGRRLKKIESTFLNMELPKGQKRFGLPNERPRPLRKPIYIPNKTVENLYFYIDTFLKRRLSDPEIDSLSLANTILTSTLYSRILGTARERALSNVTPLFELIKEQIRDVRAGNLKMSEVRAAKQYGLGGFQRSGQTVSGTAIGYLGRYFFDGVISDYYRIPERIKDVRKNDITRVLNKMFEEKIWGLGMLGAENQSLVDKLHYNLKELWD
jgi:Peptidase M16 inactive domain